MLLRKVRWANDLGDETASRRVKYNELPNSVARHQFCCKR